jgi:hypothetical protein
MDIYWHLKLLLGRAMVDRKEDKNKIMLQLDEIQGQLQLHDYKLNLMAKQMAGLDLSHITLPQAQVPLMRANPLPSLNDL